MSDQGPIEFWDAYLDWAARAPQFKDNPDQVYEPIFVRFKDDESFQEFNKAAKQKGAEITGFLNLVIHPMELQIAIDARTNGSKYFELFLYRQINLDCATQKKHAVFFDILDVGAPARIFTDIADPAEPLGDVSVDTIGAIIDEGIGFLNRRFRTGKNKTRFLKLWLQSRERVSVPDGTIGRQELNIGRVLNAGDIDELIDADKPEEQIYLEVNRDLYGADSSHARLLRADTHGTAIADLAYGAGADDTMANIPLLAVQLPPEAVNDTSGTYSESYILQAVRWLCFEARGYFKSGIDTLKTEQAPPPQEFSELVINISYGVIAGQKDGGKFLEAQIAKEVEQAKARGQTVHIVYAYGNNFGSKQIAQMTVAKNKPATVDWAIQPDNPTASFLEIRRLCPCGKILTGVPEGMRVKLIAPDGTGVLEEKLKQGHTFPAASKSVDPYKLYHVPERAFPDRPTQPNYLTIAIGATRYLVDDVNVAQAGGWQVEVSTDCETAQTLVLQIQRGDTAPGLSGGGRQSYFDVASTSKNPVVTDEGSNSAYTTATGTTLHTVGAAAGIDTDYRPATYTSQGAAWSGGGPSVSAIVEPLQSRRGLLAAGTYSDTYTRVGGTSAAAALKSRSLVFGLSSRHSGNTDEQDRLGDEVIC